MTIESVMPSNHLILCHHLLLLPSIFPSIRVFSNESVFCIRWPKYWSFSFSISPSNEYSERISFRMKGWISLKSKGLSRVFSNTTVQEHQFFGTQLSFYRLYSSWGHKKSNTTEWISLSVFFIVQLSHPYMTTGKTIALTRRTFVGKVMSLLFKMLSRLIIAFLPRSKHLFNFMAAFTICSDFGAQEINVNRWIKCVESE